VKLFKSIEGKWAENLKFSVNTFKLKL